MKKCLSLVIAAVALLAVVACGSKTQKGGSNSTAAAENEDDAPKALVLYYSQTGSTKTVAEQLQRKLGADIEAIELETPYSGTYEQTIERAKGERESGTTPKLKPLKSNIADYETVFLGYPVWFGTYALPIASLVKDYDFSGIRVVPFCTFGSGGLDASVNDLKAALPKAEVANGYGVRTARLVAAGKELDRFLIENGYKEGTVEPLPEYSEQKPVTEEEKAYFSAACNDYKFPLGTPVTVGKRTTPDGVDYKYTVKNTSPTGEVSTATIYVTISKDSPRPMFTQVVR